MARVESKADHFVLNHAAIGTTATGELLLHRNGGFGILMREMVGLRHMPIHVVKIYWSLRPRRREGPCDGGIRQGIRIIGAGHVPVPHVGMGHSAILVV